MKIEKDKNFEEERSYLINERNVDEDLILELEKEAIKEVERKEQARKINRFNTRHSKTKILFILTIGNQILYVLKMLSNMML